MRNRIAFILLFLMVHHCYAQDNGQVRPVPPPGIEVPDGELKELKSGLQKLQTTIKLIQSKQDAATEALLPDVLIYEKAIDYAIRYGEFFYLKDVASARKMLNEGQERADALLTGQAPWTRQKGEVMRGYRSSIDGSVQPYGLSIPEDYDAEATAFNLSLWYHGRGEYLSELNFMANGKGFFPLMPQMKNTIMLYPYGRYCNGFKFAGETDVWEALASVKKQYHINENGIFNRGFSMGGAAAWQFAVHFPDQWLASNPGAGFAETTEFLKLDHEIFEPNAYEKKLLHLYDCTDYAGNLDQASIFAYNGDRDLQKQAADVMELAMQKEGLKLTRVTGKNIGHAYTKAAALTADSLLETAAAKGKITNPRHHWSQSRVEAVVEAQQIKINCTNVSALSLRMDSVSKLLNTKIGFSVLINGVRISVKANELQDLHFYENNGRWDQGTPKGLLKKHDLQGPVDDAFMSSFIVVKPTGTSPNALFDRWSKAEMDRFVVQWRRQFRGDALVIDDVDVKDADLSKNLILFGDVQSNAFLAKISKQLPVKWNAKRLLVDHKSYPANHHGLIMIYPNPLRQDKYIVLNSGFTFREASFLNNAKQIAMLPDWAVIDLNTAPGPEYPGKIEAAGFFGAHWEW